MFVTWALKPKSSKLFEYIESSKVSTAELDWEASKSDLEMPGIALYPTIIADPYTCNPLIKILPQLKENPSVKTIISVGFLVLFVEKNSLLFCSINFFE